MRIQGMHSPDIIQQFTSNTFKKPVGKICSSDEGHLNGGKNGNVSMTPFRIKGQSSSSPLLKSPEKNGLLNKEHEARKADFASKDQETRNTEFSSKDQGTRKANFSSKNEETRKAENNGVLRKDLETRKTENNGVLSKDQETRKEENKEFWKKDQGSRTTENSGPLKREYETRRVSYGGEKLRFLPAKSLEKKKYAEERGMDKSINEGSDGMLQWASSKRPRGNRAELKAYGENHDSNVGESVHASKKQKLNITVHSRRTTLRPGTPGRDSNQGIVKRRSEDFNSSNQVEDVSQKIKKRSSSPAENNERRQQSCFSPTAKTRASEAMHRNSTPSETRPCAPPERINFETFEWPRIFIHLSHKEKDDDFLAMKSKLPQRPKKRLKPVEKALQNCFPGSWLSDLTKGRYDVKEKKCPKNKPRGLKALQSIESDSDC